MKNIKIIILSLTMVSATSSLATTCFVEGDSLLICQYEGETGLELIENPKLSDIQRKPVYIQNEVASIVLVRNASVQGKTYSECWSTASTMGIELTLHCSQEQSVSGEIPVPILSQIN